MPANPPPVAEPARPSDPAPRRSATERLAGLNEFQRREFPTRLRAHEAAHPGYTRRWYELEDVLVAIGGTAIVVGFAPDADLETVLSSGRLVSASHVERSPGEPSQCHANVAREWLARDAGVEIVTGYALSRDGLWREHSWLVDADVVIETTELRVAYYGVTLAFPKAAVFAAANLAGADPASVPTPSVALSERILDALGYDQTSSPGTRTTGHDHPA